MASGGGPKVGTANLFAALGEESKKEKKAKKEKRRREKRERKERKERERAERGGGPAPSAAALAETAAALAGGGDWADLDSDDEDEMRRAYEMNDRLIARALSVTPRLIIADEPVSALDVSVQAQVVNLMAELQEEFDLTYLFVAHDLSVVEHISDRVAVMYLGQIVELTTSDRLYERPLHPYTAALMSAVPVADPDHKMQRIPLEGDVPDPANAPSGCKFHPRCQHAEDRCRTESPELREIEPGHETSCHFAGELTFQKMESAHVG